MNKHPHAELMKLYAEDAMVAVEPWKLWEFQLKDEAVWYRLTNHPAWSHEAKYRRRAKTVNIDGVEFPVPISIANDDSVNRDYFTIYVTDSGVVVGRINRELMNVEKFNVLLKQGLIFEKRDDCERYVEALSELNKKISSRFYEELEKEN
jgi:hypothetical protein|nr:MAG TPA: hypothetical protein [Caudoviricetes sp.]